MRYHRALGYADKIAAQWGINHLIAWVETLRQEGMQIEVTIIGDKIAGAATPEANKIFRKEIADALERIGARRLANAAWYSNNLAAGKRLIVRLHAQEVRGSALQFGKAINVERVDQFIFAAGKRSTSGLDRYSRPAPAEAHHRHPLRAARLPGGVDRPAHGSRGLLRIRGQVGRHPDDLERHMESIRPCEGWCHIACPKITAKLLRSKLVCISNFLGVIRPAKPCGTVLLPDLRTCAG
ncbi:hypothetical protein [Roseovarius sp. M141]|uniref:hypothetical protein n=1 Tax=Roseovarius sp. M141 TaxID=2583806 RepID=UPI0020CC7544|nr:hypothetical protein [Roseovarius sp. M141]MCQ0094206.1 hypothetical protein [Roseovarius sp. M141]